MTSITGRVVEAARIGNMATANRLAVLQKVKQEKKGVAFWSFSSDLKKKKTKQNVRSGELTKITETQSGEGEAMAVLP
jgi:hypothetical protein